MVEGREKEFITQRVNLPTAKNSSRISAEIPPEIRAKAFFSARVAEAHILERFREISDRYSSGEISRGEAMNLLKEYAGSQGKDDGSKGLRNLASTARLNLILDQNAKMARAVGQYEAMHRPANLKMFPYVIYRASVGSKSPRDSHQKYDGMVIDKRDPWLRTHWPPWEFGCNCDLSNCSAKKAATLGPVKPLSKPEDVKIESDSGFAFDPATWFQEYDVSIIQDEALRQKTIDGIKELYSEAVILSEPPYGKIETGAKPFDEALDSFARKAPHEIKQIIKGTPMPEVKVDRPGDDARYLDGVIHLGPQALPKHCIHEFAHHFDAVIISKNPELLDLKNQKIRGILERLDGRIRLDSEFRERLQAILVDADKRNSLYLSTIADLLGAISRNKVGYGHSDEYWARDEYTRSNEAVAQMFVLYGRQVKEWKILTLLIPELAQSFRELISKSLDYMI